MGLKKNLWKSFSFAIVYTIMDYIYKVDREALFVWSDLLKRFVLYYVVAFIVFLVTELLKK